MNEHKLYMRRAIELAANVPNFPFGALIVDRTSGKILSEGWNKSSINPTFHGEIDAINQLVLSHPGIDASRLALYTTAEPCPRGNPLDRHRKRCLWHIHSFASKNGLATD